MFAPGSDSRKLEKVFSLPVDVMILDLEDAVALNEKARARGMIREALDNPREPRAYVRVNAVSTDLLFDDLDAVVCPNLDGIVLPKADSPQDVQTADWLLTELERKRGVGAGRVDLVPLVESAAAILRAEAVASASPRIRRLAFGAMDFVLDIGASWDKEGTALLYARSHLVLASRVAGIEAPIDTVYPDLRDIDGLVAESQLVRKLGFQGKMVLHPAQIEPVNRVFSPTEAEIEEARKTVEAFAQAEARGSASIQVDGKFIDYPVADRARKLLQNAEALGLA
jgi:citrate lyase subunit beta/citryl-CoA lyase